MNSLMSNFDRILESPNLDIAGWKDLLSRKSKKEVDSPPSVLVIDDDPIFCKLAIRAAKKLGIRIQICSSLIAVTKLASKPVFDVVILDYYFDGMTGTQLSFLLDREMPIVITSNTKRSEILEIHWPSSIREFFHKSKGVETILKDSLKIAGHSKFAKTDLSVLDEGEFNLNKDIVPIWFVIGLILSFVLILWLIVSTQTGSPPFFWDGAPTSNAITKEIFTSSKELATGSGKGELFQVFINGLGGGV